MYEGSDDGSNCDGYNSPGESMSELDLFKTFGPDGSPIILPPTPPPRPSQRIGVCLTIQVAGILNLLQPWSDKVSLLD